VHHRVEAVAGLLDQGRVVGKAITASVFRASEVQYTNSRSARRLYRFSRI
jgi:hypothetical protein